MPPAPNPWVLQPGQQAAWPAAEGDEVFCAAGSVRIQLTGSPDLLPARVLQAGQSLRASTAGVFRVEGVAAARGRFTALPLAEEANDRPVPKTESLGPFGRRLSWMWR